MRLRRVSITPSASPLTVPDHLRLIAYFGDAEHAKVPHFRQLLPEQISVHQLWRNQRYAKYDTRIGVPPIFFTADQQIPTGR